MSGHPVHQLGQLAHYCKLFIGMQAGIYRSKRRVEALSPADRDGNHAQSGFQTEFDDRLTRALETALELSIPSDFAARIAGQLPPLARPAPETASLTPRYFGRNATIVSMVVLFVLIFAFAHRATGSSLLWTTAEWIFCVQFAILAVWLVSRRLSPYRSRLF